MKPNDVNPGHAALSVFIGITLVTIFSRTSLTLNCSLLRFLPGGCMKDIHEVLRRKQAKYTQLGKQIELLQQAAEKLREVAPLLTENDDDDGAILTDLDEPATVKAQAAAVPAPSSAPKPAPRPMTSRWP
jgi:hypothetical protein